MDSTPTTARTEQSSLPPAYLDPQAYLRRDEFHRETTYAPSYAPAGSLERHVVSYAVAGSLSPSAPVVVWLNGMGGHRLAVTLLDGIFASRGVRLVTLDRPSAGRSTPVPLRHRLPASHDALLAVLAAEHVSTFSLLSHSNGILYALYTLRHLPSHLNVRSWTLSSPYVPPWLSGSVALSAARWIPAPLVGQLGTVAGAVQRLAGPLERGMGWSSAAVRDWGGWASMGPWSSSSSAAAAPPRAAASTTAGEEDPELLPPPKQLARFRRLNAQRPPHKRLFGGFYLPPGFFARGMQVAIDEGLDSMGQEAMLCLRQGGARWECPGEEEAARGEGGGAVDEGRLYERAFEGLRDLLRAEGREVEVSVWCGEDDALVPGKGREYLRALLVDRLSMVDPSRWHEVEDAGHDDTLGLSCVIEPLLDDVQRAHEQ